MNSNTHSYIYVFVKNEDADTYLIYTPTNKYYEKDYFTVPMIEVEQANSIEDSVSDFLQNKNLQMLSFQELVQEENINQSKHLGAYNTVCALATVRDDNFDPRGDHAHGSFIPFRDLKNKISASPAVDEVTIDGLKELERLIG